MCFADIHQQLGNESADKLAWSVNTCYQLWYYLHINAITVEQLTATDLLLAALKLLTSYTTYICK